MDQLKYQVSYNLSTVNFSKVEGGVLRLTNIGDITTPKIELYRLKYLTLNGKNPNISSTIEVKFINKTNEQPFNFSSVDFKVRTFKGEFENGDSLE